MVSLRYGRRKQLVVGRSIFFLVIVGALALYYNIDRSSPSSSLKPSERSLLTAEEPLDSDKSFYPNDLILTKPYAQSENKIAIILHFIGVLYSFAGLAIVCDDYFVAALEVMVEKWKMTPDVAGATLMAAGGSAPELFTSLIGVTISESDVGFGTIVGSAVFNVLFVISLCAMFAKEKLRLTAWPLFRDCSYYCMSLLVLAVLVSSASTEEGMNSGGEVTLTESIILFLMYLLYVYIMSKNDKLKSVFESFFQRQKVIPADVDEKDDTQIAIFTPRQTGLHFIRDVRGAALKSILNGTVKEMMQEKMQKWSHNPEFKGKAPVKKLQTAADYVLHQARTMSKIMSMDTLSASDSEKKSSGSKSSDSTPPPLKESQGEDDDSIQQEYQDEQCEEDGGLFDWPDTTLARILFVINFPLNFLLTMTIPNCADSKWQNYFLLTFFLSLVWIAIFSFFMVWWAEIIGEVLGIPTTVMGITFLAAGTSIPDALSSVIVARQGFGDMAVSSSIGSNIFDILFGLPVPWMIKTGIILHGDGVVLVHSKYLVINVVTLLFMVAFVILSIIYCKWELNKKLGGIMFILYMIFIVVSLSLEYCSPLGLCS